MQWKKTKSRLDGSNFPNRLKSHSGNKACHEMSQNELNLTLDKSATVVSHQYTKLCCICA